MPRGKGLDDPTGSEGEEGTDTDTYPQEDYPVAQDEASAREIKRITLQDQATKRAHAASQLETEEAPQRRLNQIAMMYRRSMEIDQQNKLKRRQKQIEDNQGATEALKPTDEEARLPDPKLPGQVVAGERAVQKMADEARRVCNQLQWEDGASATNVFYGHNEKMAAAIDCEVVRTRQQAEVEDLALYFAVAPRISTW